MIMLYAKHIDNMRNNQRIERLIIKKNDIVNCYVSAASDNPIVIRANDINKVFHNIVLKPNKNFSTVMEFFEYIRDYSEIAFETKEIPTKREIKVGDIYSYGKDFYYVVFCIRDDIENRNDKRIDFLRIYQENLVGMDRNESLSFLKDMDYIGNSAVSINNIISSIDSILSLTN